MASYLCVYDRDLYEELIYNGADLLNEQKGINGEVVWTFALGNLHFDIQDESMPESVFSPTDLL